MFSLSFTFPDNPCLFFISFTSITVLSFFKVVDRDSETRPQLIFGLLDIFSHCSVSRELGSSARFDLFYIDLLWVNVLLCGTKIPHHRMFFGLNSSLSDNFLENLISTSSGKFFFSIHDVNLVLIQFSAEKTFLIRFVIIPVSLRDSETRVFFSKRDG